MPQLILLLECLNHLAHVYGILPNIEILLLLVLDQPQREFLFPQSIEIW